MLVKDISNIIEDMAPIYLKESYDNVGLMVGENNKEVKRILLSLDCTLNVIDEAIEKNVDLIITHHPLLFRKPSSITNDSLMGKKIIKLIRNDISLYAAHTNLDSVENGLNDTIVSVLGYSKGKVMEVSKVKGHETSGIGRIVKLNEEITLKNLLDNIQDKLHLKGLRYAGDLKQKINKIAVVNGSGQDFMDMAYKLGAQALITGDTTYHFVSDYKEMGLGIIDIGHFGSEWQIFLKVCEKFKESINNIDENIEILISEKAEDPYEFIINEK